MDARLLQTKLFVPVTRASHVHRPRLVARLERGIQGPLTLLSAPAGSGKTTLVADWLQATGHPASWLSLDEGDNECRRFIRYFIASLRQHHPELGGSVLATLTTPNAIEPLELATDFVNDLVENPGRDVLLVLDDFHVIEAAEVNEVVAFLVEAAPANFHLVMTTRADPPFPLSRLRARGLLTEVRQPDLRFTREEAAAFLADVMRLDLTAEQVARLEARTEGWAVGLQMAALSLQGRTDVGAFLESFTGSHSYVLDYLLDEVLARLGEDDRRFLKQTSILRELTPAIVDAVTERTDSAERLREHERKNLFVVPLDDRRTAYRYHHLFGTLLRHELETSVSPEERAALHRRAAAALQASDRSEQALDHALLAGDFELVERLFIPMAMQATIRGEHDGMLRYLVRIPEAERRRRPALALARGWLLHHIGEALRDVPKFLADVRAELTPPLSPAIEAELVLLEGMVRCDSGDPDGAEAVLPRLDALPIETPYLRTFEVMHRVYVAMARDRLEDAAAVLDRARQIIPATQDPFALLWAQWQRAHVDLLQGRLVEARAAHEAMLQRIDDLFDERPPPSSVVGFGTALQIYLLQHDLEPARALIERAHRSQGLDRDPHFALCVLLPEARLQAHAGEDWQPTLDRAARHLGAEDSEQSLPKVEAYRVRLALHREPHPAAAELVARWLATPGIRNQTHELYAGALAPGVALDMPRFVLARALVFAGELEAAEAIASGVVERARLAGRRVCELEARLVLAEAASLRGDSRAAHAALQEAVRLGAETGAVAPFLELGGSVLCEGARLARECGHSILAAALEPYIGRIVAPVPTLGLAAAVPDRHDLLEPLSDRELEVLGLVAQGLSNAEASRRLFVAPSTVKKHLEHVYGKLGVHRRTQAIARARSLGLLRS